MGRNDVRPGTDGAVRTEFGGYAPELRVTAWNPPRRFGYRTGQAPDGRFIAYEFLIEGRAGGSTAVRVVTSGFIPGDDWEDEYEAMAMGSDLHVATLAEYLARFRGRFAVPVTAFGPPGTDWDRDRRLIFDALGLPGGGAAGSKVRLTAAESGPAEGVLYFVSAATIGVRTSSALYRFLRGFGKPVVASHHLFNDADPEHAERCWESWLARVFGGTRQPQMTAPELTRKDKKQGKVRSRPCARSWQASTSHWTASWSPGGPGAPRPCHQPTS